MNAIQHIPVIAALVFSASAVPVYAKPPSGPIEPEAQIGTRLQSRPTQVDPREAGVIRKSFARCLYNRAPARVDRLLEHSDPAGIEYYAAGTTAERFRSDVGMNYCLQLESAVSSARQLTTSNTAFRSMLLEEAYLARFDRAPTLAEDAGEAVDRRYITEGDTSARALGRFADCLVFRDTAAADAMLRTMPGSAEEKQVAKGMAPVLGACLERGHTLALTMTNIRSFAADGLWTRFVRETGSAPAPAN